MFLTIGVLYKATTINVQSPGWLKLLSFEQFFKQGEICTNATACYQFFLIKQEALTNISLFCWKFRFFRFEKVVIFSIFLLRF